MNLIKGIIVLLLATSCLDGKAQKPLKILSKDTIELVQARVFNYITSNISNISLQNFSSIQKDSTNIIFYTNTHTAESFYQNLFVNPGFKKLLSAGVGDKGMVIDIPKRKIDFIEKRISDFKNVSCYLLFYPLVLFKDKIYCHLITRSRPIGDINYMGEINIVFNNRLEILDVRYFDSIID